MKTEKQIDFAPPDKQLNHLGGEVFTITERLYGYDQSGRQFLAKVTVKEGQTIR
ncbi:MAG: hypothetical protein JO253_08160 [Alphaproteobacteria bacterium]|nr:hypothetical protein [Alphaproteobacteria bacterium]